MQHFDHLANDQLLVLALENRNRIDSLVRARGVASRRSDSRRKARDLKRELALMDKEIFERTGREH